MLDRDTFTHVQTNAIGTTRLAQQISLVSSFYAQRFMFDDFVEIPGHMDVKVWRLYKNSDVNSLLMFNNLFNQSLLKHFARKVNDINFFSFLRKIVYIPV